MNITTAANARTTRKIVGSLGILGAAAAVAGLGTFGTFTDSTTPVNASVASGTLNIDLNAVNSTASLPLTATNFVPGDKLTRSFDLVNTGNLNFSGISLQSTATTASILTTDKTNGLQLGLDKCSVAWTEQISNGVPTYTCSGTKTTVIASNGATGAVLNQYISGAGALTAGGTDHFVVSLSLPLSADNTFQGKSAALSVSFSGAQADGTAR